jgi:unsaturated chondroitin disaccharide hydrolase
LWLAYLLSGEQHFADSARRWCQRLAPQLFRRDTHDLGMLAMPSFVHGWRVTNDEALKFGALSAAEGLLVRFNRQGRFLRALGSEDDAEQRGYVIIDTLMNLPLLFWASDATGDARYRSVAQAHLNTSRARHLRDDGSTWQVFNFDAETAAPLGPSWYQGLSIDSCWSRGQAWAIAGLAAAHSWTGGETVLADAFRVADWWLRQVPTDGVPAWDFSARGDDEPRDSSAAAIAACGLLDLAPYDRDAYRRAAHDIARTLHRSYASRSNGEAGILLHGTGVKPRDREVDVSLSYGDYFYVELLLRIAKPEAFATYFSSRVTQ